MNNLKIIYTGEYSFNVFDHPVSAKHFLPDWFKNLSEYEDGANQIKLINRVPNYSAKKCVPMLDAMLSGYIVPLPVDVVIEQTERFGPTISWKTGTEVFEIHGGSSAHTITTPPGYYPKVFKLNANFRIETPKGTSILVNQPFGHYDLPFYALPAVIDTDYNIINLNFPVWIKNDYNGVVSKGTPVVQITPFQRSNWQLETIWETEKDYYIREEKGFASNIINNYLRNIRQKKVYND